MDFISEYKDLMFSLQADYDEIVDYYMQVFVCSIFIYKVWLDMFISVLHFYLEI